MKLIEQVRLAFQSGKSDKVYEVDLCQVGDDQYVVNFRYGRRGTTLKDGSKTPVPVTREKADKIFNELITSKTKKGYWHEGQKPSTPSASRPAPPEAKTREGLSARKRAVLKQLKEAAEEESERPLERLIWRAGEMYLSEALPYLRQIAGFGSAMENYCLAWALGRCGDQSILPILWDMSQDNNQPEYVRLMAKEAFRTHCPEPELTDFLNKIIDRMPPHLKNIYMEGSPQTLETQLSDFLSNARPEEFEILNDLYLVNDERTRPALLKILKVAPLKPNYFKWMRRLFKVAEFRCDGQVFGIIAHRFAMVKAYTRQYEYSDDGVAGHEYIRNIIQELKKTHSKAAYTRKTREYFLLRTWRTLKRLAQLEDENYVKMAVGVLLTATDEEQGEDVITQIYDWDASRYHTYSYDGYAYYYAFNQILYANSKRFINSSHKSRWMNRVPNSPVPRDREEAFPHLWDQYPTGLLHLLADSRCKKVHEFAAKALRENTQFLDTLEIDVISMMLSSPYEVTNRLGLDLAKKRYNPASPDIDLVLAVLYCPWAEAGNVAWDWVQQNRGFFLQHIDFIVKINFAPHEDLRKKARQLLSEASFSTEESGRLLKRFLDEILLRREPDQAALVGELGETVRLVFASQLRQLDMETISRLFAHPLPAVQAFAGHILLEHDMPAEKIPGEFISQLVESEDENARRVGIRLFGKLPLDSLFSRQKEILSFCLSPLPDIRESVRPILEKLAAVNPEFGQLLARTLAYHLLQKEKYEGLYKDLTVTLNRVLFSSLAGIDKGLTLRLIKSRSTVVQEFGGQILLNVYRESSFEVRQIIGFARHDILKIREFAWQWCRDNIDRLKQEMNETVRIFDTQWDDTREFAFSFFRENLGKEELTPETLVGICDSVRPDVQRFGCDMITRYFQEEDGQQYLVKLSQHPSTNLQLFVTNYLSRYASGRPDRIKELTDYFVIVLSQVNRGRVSRHRIFNFFKEEALKDIEIARIVLEIVVRVSLTMAVGDKATCIQLMRDIHQAYPDIRVPLFIKPVELHKGVQHVV